jgi:hypothetical protein
MPVRLRTERVLAIANFICELQTSVANENVSKACFGATPKPARETRALPKDSRTLAGCLSCKLDGESSAAQFLCPNDRPL